MSEVLAEASTKERLVQRLVRFLESGESEDLFGDDAFFDLNVPAWRFQVRDPGAFEDWWHQEVQHRGRATVGRSALTPTGFVVETAIEFEHHGDELYARQVCWAEVAGDRIVELTVYCTGDWDSETRARQASDAPMFRP